MNVVQFLKKLFMNEGVLIEKDMISLETNWIGTAELNNRFKKLIKKINNEKGGKQWKKKI